MPHLKWVLIFLAIFIESNEVWKNFDRIWLKQLARKQKPEAVWLIDAIEKCSQYEAVNDAYIRFVDSEKEEQEGVERIEKENIMFRDFKYGMIVLDVSLGKKVANTYFEDPTILGLEYVDRI